MNGMRCRYPVGVNDSRRWIRPADYFYVPVAASKSSFAAAVTVVRSIVRTVARQSPDSIHCVRPPAAINKVGKADLTMPNACAVTGFDNKK
jgi:hypothetical protein